MIQIDRETFHQATAHALCGEGGSESFVWMLDGGDVWRAIDTTPSLRDAHWLADNLKTMPDGAVLTIDAGRLLHGRRVVAHLCCPDDYSKPRNRKERPQ